MRSMLGIRGDLLRCFAARGGVVDDRAEARFDGAAQVRRWCERRLGRQRDVLKVVHFYFLGAQEIVVVVYADRDGVIQPVDIAFRICEAHIAEMRIGV